MTELPPVLLPPLTADASEQELGLEVDEVMAGRGYPSPVVVGIGGSAGSITALQRFLEACPPDPGVALVIVMHLSPEHETALSGALQPWSKLPVVQAANGQEVLVNHAYVIPPGKQLSIADGRLRVTELRASISRPMVVDLFFRSLADTLGPRGIAVVLAGTDGDGALGVKRVKERGGLTIAQDPVDTQTPEMPQAAIDTHMVDWILRVEEMPRRLVEYALRERRLQLPSELPPGPSQQTGAAAGADELSLRAVLSFVRRRTGRDFSYYKRDTIVRRIARRMHVTEVETVGDYLSYLRVRPGEAGALLQDLLISVTNFFRDSEAFEAFAAMVPRLFERKVASDTVRVWVPACATGEEAYSIAMLLSEHASTLPAPPALQIFATDLNEEALLEARSGLYPLAISTDVSEARLLRYFVREQAGYRVRRELREVLRFGTHDLLKDAPFLRLDALSCRNLLIYLNREAQQRAHDIFHFALHAEGVLFLGTGETIEAGSQQFRIIDAEHRVYTARVGTKLRSSPSLAPDLAAGVLAFSPPIMSAPSPVPAALAAEAAVVRGAARPRASWSGLHLELFERLGPPSLLCDAEYEILYMTQSAGPFLRFAGGEPGANLLTVIHPSLRAGLRAALYSARQAGEAAVAESVQFVTSTVRRLVDIRAAVAAELNPTFVLVTFVARELPEDAAPEEPAVEGVIVAHLERELHATKLRLRDTVEQHVASAEDFKASNEELQVMNEELRAASEEIEHSRQELQSMNEELVTLNHQLKSSVDELGHAYSDLHNLMGATAIATIFLDQQLRIMRFTPSAVELFSLISTDVGRPLAHLQHQLAYPNLLADVARVLDEVTVTEHEVATADGRWFLARLLPYRGAPGRIAGVVLTFFDITERQQAQADLRHARAELEQRVKERTAELDDVNSVLRKEVLGHQTAEKERQSLQRKLVLAQEEERSRISRELHDQVGQQLSALTLGLKALTQSVKDEPGKAELEQMKSVAEEMAIEIHQLAFTLWPRALDQLGLARALGDYLETWSTRTGVQVQLVTAGIEDSRLPRHVESTLYRVVLEAMNNIQKHAAARNVSVSVHRGRTRVVTIVEDDGSGFGPEPLVPVDDRPQLGIAGMRDRVAIVDGDLDIESVPGQGTTLRVRIPLRD